MPSRDTVTYVPTPDTVDTLHRYCRWKLLRLWGIPLGFSILAPSLVLVATNQIIALTLFWGLLAAYIVWELVAMYLRKPRIDQRWYCENTVSIEPDALASQSELGTTRIARAVVDEVTLADAHLFFVTRCHSNFTAIPCEAFGGEAEAKAFQESVIERTEASTQPLEPGNVSTPIVQVRNELETTTIWQTVTTGIQQLLLAAVFLVGGVFSAVVISQVLALIGVVILGMATFRFACVLTGHKVWWQRFRMQSEFEDICVVEEGLLRRSEWVESLEKWHVFDAVENAKGVIAISGLNSSLIPETAFDDPHQLNDFVNAVETRITLSHEASLNSEASQEFAAPEPERSENPYAAPQVDDATAKHRGVPVLEFTVQESELLAAEKAVARKGGDYAVVVTIVIFGLATWLANVFQSPPAIPWVIAWVVVGYLGYLVGNLWGKSRTRRLVAADPLRFAGPHRLAVFGDSIWQSANGYQSKTKVSELRLRGSTRKRLVLKRSDGVTVVPKSEVTWQEYDTLLKTLKQRAVKRT